MPANQTDKYVNMITGDLALSAANTLTFEEINVGLNIFDKVGLLITRLEYDTTMAAIAEMTASGDFINAGFTTSNQVSSLLINKSEVVDQVVIGRHDMGAAAAAQLFMKPWVRDFSTQPGGGLLVPPKPLYFAGYSGGLASPCTLYLRFYFIIIKLTDAEYLELLETRRAFG